MRHISILHTCVTHVNKHILFQHKIRETYPFVLLPVDSVRRATHFDKHQIYIIYRRQTERKRERVAVIPKFLQQRFRNINLWNQKFARFFFVMEVANYLVSITTKRKELEVAHDLSLSSLPKKIKLEVIISFFSPFSVFTDSLHNMASSR